MTRRLPFNWTAFKRRFFPRGLSFTREGKVYVAVTLLVGFAAVNTNNNLLFLVLGLMLGLIIVSGILSENTLRGVQVRRRLPRRVEAETSFAVELLLKNTKRLAASFAVELKDEIDGEMFRRRCFFLRVGPSEERAISYKCEIQKRGLSRFSGTMISTRFPFGLFEKRRFFALEDEVIVLPAKLPVSVPARLLAVGNEGRTAVTKGLGQEFRELREIYPSDDPRMIHWRASARMGRLMVRENDAETRGFVEVVLDAAPVRLGEEALERVERDIRAAGTVVRNAALQGCAVVLATSGARLEASDKNGVVALLDHLALLDPAAEMEKPPPVGVTSASVLIGPRAGGGGELYRLTVPQAVGEEGAGG